LQNEIAGSIESQVMRLIEQARHDTESKVKAELKQIVDVMKVLDTRLDSLLAQLDAMETPKAAEPALDVEQVTNLLSKIEQQWGQEIRTLKQELHQTILAHNHNADLIKHHKDTIDGLRQKCDKIQIGNVKTSEIQQQLQKLDKSLKQQQKQRKLEPLFDRLAVLEQKVTAAAQQSYRGGYPLMPAMVPPPGPLLPGVSGHPGVPPGIMPPGMGPPGMGGAGKGASAKAAAFRCPTDEEVQARLSKLAQASAAEEGAEGAKDEE
jgi:hypothetical protein